jgi:hypothetical protein
LCYEVSTLGGITEILSRIRCKKRRSHFPDIENATAYTVSTLLDPRFKKTGFSSQNKADRAERKLRELAAEVELNRTARSNPDHSGLNQPSDDWDACMGLVPDPEVTVQCVNSADAEVTAYLAENNTSRDSCPFTWWKVNQEKYPTLASLGKRFLSAPMGSIASEREFKVAKRVTNGRYNLKPGNVQKLLFLKYNLRMLNYDI